MKIEFFLIKTDDTRNFIDSINSFLQDGWELHGNVNVAVEDQVIQYVQAFTRKIESKPNDLKEAGYFK